MSNEWCVGYIKQDHEFELFGWWDLDYERFVDHKTAERLLEVKVTEPSASHSRVNLMPLYRKV